MPNRQDGLGGTDVAQACRPPGAQSRLRRPHFLERLKRPLPSEKIRLICIGDAHDSPRLADKSRFEQIGRYIRSVKPDVVVQIGDFVSLDSLTSFNIETKPSFIADMASFDEALTALNVSGPECHCTLGNHEGRLYRFERRAPEVTGMMQEMLLQTFQRHKWTFSPYGQITMYGGVGFVHTPLNGLGCAYGGKTAEQAIANDAIHDLVMGHSHVERRHRAPKIGANSFVQIINVGCALPDNHVEDYAQHALTGWSYGIADMTIKHGHVQDYRFISMATLGESYGPPQARGRHERSEA